MIGDLVSEQLLKMIQIRSGTGVRHCNSSTSFAGINIPNPSSSFKTEREYIVIGTGMQRIEYHEAYICMAISSHS